MRKYVAFFILLVIIPAILFSGCGKWNSPLDVSVVQQTLQENYDDIMVIVEYLAESQYEVVIITDTSGEMLADLKTVSIENDKVCTAVKKLIKNGIYQKVFKTENTISFLQKAITMGNISCYLAYSINGVDSPQLQYLTETIPLEQENWYYCICDYEKSRLEHT